MLSVARLSQDGGNEDNEGKLQAAAAIVPAFNSRAILDRAIDAFDPICHFLPIVARCLAVAPPTALAVMKVHQSAALEVYLH